MVVLALTVVAAILLGHGYVTESRDEVIAAGAVSILSILIVIVERVRSRRQRTDETGTPVDLSGGDSDDETADEDDSDDDDGDRNGVGGAGERVVFVPGRTTFHRPTCSAVAGKQTSAAERGELEAGGMQPCRRCIPEEPGAGRGRALRLA